MTTATDTFRQHLQETQAIHFLPYVGDGYADARPRILMIGEANHGTAPDGADRTYTDGVVRRALQDAAEGNGNHWVRYIRKMCIRDRLELCLRASEVCPIEIEEIGRSHKLIKKTFHTHFTLCPCLENGAPIV